MVGNTETGTILNLTGTEYNTNTATYTASSGEHINLNGEATTTFNTSSDGITFGTSTIEMGNGSNLVVDTSTGTGAINILGGVMGTSSETITLTAGTGDVAIGAIGTGTEVADVSITSTGTTTFHGDFTGGALTNTGNVVIADDITIGTGAVTFGGTLDSNNGNQTVIFNNPGADIEITGVVGGSNPFSTFKITDADTFTYSGGGSISGFSSGKFSRTGGFAIFNPGPSIDNVNTSRKNQGQRNSFL